MDVRRLAWFVVAIGYLGTRPAMSDLVTTLFRCTLVLCTSCTGKAAEHHKLAAQAHRTAAEHNEKGDNETANWHSQRALEYSNRAYELAKEAHNKSGQIETLS